MSDNNEKFNKLVSESFKYPEKLSGTGDRLRMRMNKHRRKKRSFVASISALAASLMFVLLVNTSTAFANVVAEMPVIGQLAEFVKLNKSLSKAIENDYVQEINLIAWDGDRSLFLPYVIADEKNLVLFLRLPDEYKLEDGEWINIFIDNMEDGKTGEKIEGYSYSSSGISPDTIKDNSFAIIQCYFADGNLPKSLDIELEMNHESRTAEHKEEETSIYDEYEPEIHLEKMGVFKFSLDLHDFAEPIIYEINEKHTVMGQQIVVDNIKVYPAGTEVNFLFSDDNTAWIKGIDAEVLLENGSVYKGNGNGISAMHYAENKGMSVFIESNYFDKSEKQKLVIKAVRLLNKDEEYITVDVDNKTIEPKVKGMELKQVISKSGNATLVFFTETEKGDSFGMFDFKYSDTGGNEYELKSEGTSPGNNGMETMITIKSPTDGKVILKRALTPRIYPDRSIDINIPMPK